MAAPDRCSAWFGAHFTSPIPQKISPTCPAYLPVATSQSLMVLSPLTEAKVVPSGLNATE